MPQPTMPPVVLRRPKPPGVYDPLRDLREKQTAHEHASAMFNAAVEQRAEAARRAFSAGLSWDQIGAILGVKRSRAQAIAHPRHERPQHLPKGKKAR